MAPRRVRPLGPPPNERPNWHRLNEGQRRYAWEQYNLARVRRGEIFQQPDSHVTEAPVSAAPSYTDLNAAGYGRRGNPDESDDEQGGEIQVEADVHRPNDDDNSQSSSVYHTAEDSHVDLQPLIDQFHRDMADKRPSSSTDAGAPPAKKAPATGTGHNTDNLQPGGDNIVAPGPIERPLQTSGIETLTYRKVHRFLSFGLAYQPYARAIPNDTVAPGSAANFEVFMVTPMCEIPWERLFMYMNPSEYNLLPEGARVSSLHIKIRQRNVRVAFQTNASTSELATLNQNKNILYGFGLRQYNHGVNVKPTFAAEKPMVANGLTEVGEGASKDVSVGMAVDYKDHVDNLYGVRNSVAGFTTGTPRHQFGIPYILPYYYACVTRTDDPTQSGWPCFQEYVKEIDADSTSGTVILEKTYKPELGLIKSPHNAIMFSHPMKPSTASQVWEVPLGAGNANQNYQNKYTVNNHVISQKEATESYLQKNAWDSNNFATAFPYQVCQTIEKSQQYFSGHRPNHSIKTQPSLHIGVQPVPALSTKNLTATAADTTFTDTQAYWEVICTAKVVVGLPTHRPFAESANCSVDELIYRMAADDEDVNYNMQYRASMMNGLFASKIV